MASGLIVSKKRYGGEEWSNTYAFITQNDATPGLSSGDIDTITGGSIGFADVSTDPTDTNYAGSVSLLHAIIGFERTLHSNVIDFNQIYVSDGLDNTGTLSNTFAVWDTNYLGLRAVNEDQLMPGNVTLLVSRTPMGFSQRRGRLFLRGVLNEADVSFSGKRLIDFKDTAARQTYVTLVADAIIQSVLDTYLGQNGISSALSLAIPNFDPVSGTLMAATPVANLVVNRPNSRQVQRGRRRNTS
jgi:hypothetical protein